MLTERIVVHRFAVVDADGSKQGDVPNVRPNTASDWQVSTRPLRAVGPA